MSNDFRGDSINQFRLYFKDYFGFGCCKSISEKPKTCANIDLNLQKCSASTLTYTADATITLNSLTQDSIDTFCCKGELSKKPKCGSMIVGDTTSDKATHDVTGKDGKCYKKAVVCAVTPKTEPNGGISTACNSPEYLDSKITVKWQNNPADNTSCYYCPLNPKEARDLTNKQNDVKFRTDSTKSNVYPLLLNIMTDLSKKGINMNCYTNTETDINNGTALKYI